jgi:hypothetical protein
VAAKYAIAFLVLACVAAMLAFAGWEIIGWPAFLFGYAGLSFVLLSIAYFGVGARLLLKRSTGERSAWGYLLFAPYFLLNALTFRLYKLFSRELAYAEVAARLFFGRRLTTREAHVAESLGWIAVLDLAVEFVEVPALRKLPGYRSFPVLDATAPTEEQLREAVAWLNEAVKVGPVYIHCALGHGRTACVVVAYLLTVGLVPTVTEGIRLLRSFRPGVQLNRVQRRLLKRCERTPSNSPDTAKHQL